MLRISDDIIVSCNQKLIYQSQYFVNKSLTKLITKMRQIFTLFLFLGLQLSLFSQFNCNTAIDLACGQILIGNNITACSNYYNGPYCNSNDSNYTGKEKIYKITVTTTQTAAFTLSNPTADLDMFLTQACSPQACISSSYNSGAGTAEFISATLQPGVYFLIIDGWGGAAGNYSIAYTCNGSSGNLDCNLANPITCNQTLSSTTSNGVNNVVGPYCGKHCNYTGKEKIYSFDVVNTGTYTIKLTGLTADLDMFLLNSCNRNACVGTSGQAANTNETITKTLTPGTYYIVIDGYKGVSSAYNLNLSCPSTSPPLDCNTLVTSSYAGDGSNLKFNFKFNSNFACVFKGWKIGNTLYSSSPNVNFVFQAAGTYNVCAEYVDLATGETKSCCKTICAALPTNCQDIIQYNYVNGKFVLSLNGTDAIYTNVSWQNDTDHIDIDPNNVTADCRNLTVTVTYFNTVTKCWGICCRKITFCPPTSCQDNISASYSNADNSFQFNFNNSAATNIKWFLDSTNVFIPNGKLVLPSNWTCSQKVVSVTYLDTITNCWRICCKKMYLCPPIDCEKAIVYQYNSTSNKYIFTLDVPNAGNAIWRFKEGNLVLPNGEFAIPSNWACANRTVEVEYYNLLSQTWNKCSRIVNICPPVNCGENIKFQYIATGNKFKFNLEGYTNAQVVWKFEDDNSLIPNGEFPLPSNWVCKERNVQAFYYNQTSQCWYLCTKNIVLCPPSNCQTAIDFSYNAQGNKFVFSLNVANATNAVWKIDEDNVYLPNGEFVFNNNWTCATKTITVAYYDVVSHCWRTCCKKVNLCPPSYCANSILFSYIASNNKFKFTLDNANASNVSWTFADGTNLNNGEFVIPTGFQCQVKTVVVKYFVASTMTWHICAKPVNICPPKDCESSISFSYNNNVSNITFTLQATNASDIEWYFLEDNLQLQNGVYTLPSGFICGEKTIMVKYFDPSISCHRICSKKVYICPPSNCEAAIKYNYISQGNKFHFALDVANANVAFWKIVEDNVIFTNGDFVLPANFVCGNKTVQVTYYNPQTDCYATCSKQINLCPPTSCEQSIKFTYNAGYNAVAFDLVGITNASNVTWIIEETGQSLGHGLHSQDLPLPATCGIYTATAAYLVNGYWHTCCKKIYLCDPHNCSSAISYQIVGNKINLSLPAGSSDVEWSSSHPIIANGATATISTPSGIALVNVTATYKDANLGAYRTCTNSISIHPIGSGCSCTPSEYTGWSVATCNAASGSGQPVGVIFDTRNTTVAPHGADWGPSLTSIHPANWTIDKIGQVFSTTIDEYNNIYLAASDVYNKQSSSDPYGPGQIFIARPENAFLAEPFVELPNTGGPLNGIGDIVYEKTNDLFYVSNLEDGKIYRVNSLGQIIDAYDAWTADNGTSGIAPQQEQIWALGIYDNEGVRKLYFPRIGNGQRAMYSLTLNADGSFPALGNEHLEFSNIMGVGERITDIAFNSNGYNMVFSERGTNFTTGAHTSKVLGYQKDNNGVWTFDLQYYVGANVNDVYPGLANGPGENSAGGVDFGSTKVSSAIIGCDELVWSSANWFRTPDGKLYYGLQGMSSAGNNPSTATTNPNTSTDIVIDFDGQYDNFIQKGDLGDVEFFKCGAACQPPKPKFTFAINNGAYQFTNQSQGATTYSWDFGGGIIVTGNNTSPNPEVVFKHSGLYNVCLTTTNSCGTKTSCQTLNVTNENGCGINMGPQVCGNLGDVVLVPVYVNNFTNILAMNFTILSGNGNAAELIGLDQFNPAFATGNYFYTEADKIRFFWADSKGKTLPNGTIAFYVKIKLKTAFTSPITISFVNDPVKIECFNTNQALVPLNLAPGAVCMNTTLPVSGMIATTENMPVQNVMLKINNANTSMNNSTGIYNVNTLAVGGNYNVQPYKNTNHGNGINGLDILKLQRHILQIEPLTSPYKIIAADVNNDKNLNALDVVNLQKIILLDITEFPNNTSWRFVPKAYTFAGGDVLNSGFPESVNYAPLTTAMINQDFVAVKVGDLNGTSDQSSSNGHINNNRSVNDTIEMILPAQYINSGTMITIPVTVKNFKNLVSIQNTISWNNNDLEFVSISDVNLPSLSLNNFGMSQISNGNLLMSWIDENTTGVTVNDNTVIFKLNLAPKSGFNAQTTISLASQPLSMSAFDNTFTEVPFIGKNSVVTLVSPLSTNVVKQDVKCFAGNDGSIVITPIGGSGAYTYLWNNGGTSSLNNGLVQGLYTCTVTDIYTNTIMVVTENILSPTNIIVDIASSLAPSGNNNFEVNVSGGLPPYTYNWSNGSNTQNLMNVEAGHYLLTVTDLNGCIVRAEADAILSSNNELNFEKNIKIYPNPTSNILNLEFRNETACLYAWSIINALGQEIKKGNVSTCNGNTIDVSQLHTGMYKLVIIDGKQRSVLSFHRIQ